MNWFKKFMMGRYGVDQLSFALLILSMLVTLAGSLLQVTILSLVSYIPLGFIIFRMLSKNIQRRSMENRKFSTLTGPVYVWLQKKHRRIVDQKVHKYYKCRKCKAELRIPRGKGKIIVTCPKCKSEFSAKT